MEKQTNLIAIKSKTFALRIIKLYVFLRDEKNVYTLSKQLLRSGTSIGSNIRESRNAQSRMDFLSKLNIALKEADETCYWLELLHESNILSNEEFSSIYNDANELVKLLTAIIKTIKKD